MSICCQSVYLMKIFQIGGILFLGLLTLACRNDKSKADTVRSIEIPANVIDFEQVLLNNTSNLYLLKQDSGKVSGQVQRYLTPDQLIEKFGVIDGKKEGAHWMYFSDGHPMVWQQFVNNRLHGEVKRWGMDSTHQLLAHLHYENGHLHGEQKKWYPSGELHKVMHMNMGREEGMQQAFRKNGALYANYEARNGRVFGLKRSNLCYELDDEQVVYKQ